MAETSIESLSEQLNNALAALYSAFAMPAPKVIEGCPCCIEKRGVDKLLTTPLNQLSGDDLWPYVSGAFLTVGSETDFRYLLPRIFELSALKPGQTIDTEIVLHKLHLANWTAWTPRQIEAIGAMIAAWFDIALLRDRTETASEHGMINCYAEGLICGLAYARILIEPYLKRLNEPENWFALDELRKRYPKDISPFWGYAPHGSQPIADFIEQQ